MIRRKFHEFDKVVLKDGRTATIVEVLGDGEFYIVDVDLQNDWETITIAENDIKEKMR